jgi:hypothetical protein
VRIGVRELQNIPRLGTLRPIEHAASEVQGVALTRSRAPLVLEPAPSLSTACRPGRSTFPQPLRIERPARTAQISCALLGSQLDVAGPRVDAAGCDRQARRDLLDRRALPSETASLCSFEGFGRRGSCEQAFDCISTATADFAPFRANVRADPRIGRPPRPRGVVEAHEVFVLGAWVRFPSGLSRLAQGRLAQLVERHAYNVEVACSSQAPPIVEVAPGRLRPRWRREA